jgi:hypothetical protein
MSVNSTMHEVLVRSLRHHDDPYAFAVGLSRYHWNQYERLPRWRFLNKRRERQASEDWGKVAKGIRERQVNASH